MNPMELPDATVVVVAATPGLALHLIEFVVTPASSTGELFTGMRIDVAAVEPPATSWDHMSIHIKVRLGHQVPTKGYLKERWTDSGQTRCAR